MKRKIKMLKAFTGAQADTAKGKAMSPGTSTTGGTRDGNDKNNKPSKISPVVRDVPFKKPFGIKKLLLLLIEVEIIQQLKQLNLLIHF